MATTTLGNKSTGSIIKLKENGTLVDFYVAKHDYESGLNGAGRTLVVRKDTYDDRVWDSGNVNAYGFDVCIEAVGLPSTFQNCIDAAAFGGKVVLIGVGKKNLDFNFTLIQKKELNVFGSRNALKKDFVELIDLVNEGRADLGRVITNMYPADKAAEAFAEFDKNGAEMLKVVLDFTGF